MNIQIQLVPKGYESFNVLNYYNIISAGGGNNTNNDVKLLTL